MHSHILRPGRSLTFLTAALAATAAACSSDNNSAPLVAASVSVSASSQGQIGTVGTALAQAVTVQVVDQDGNPVANNAVTWTIVTGGGSVSAGTSVTDGNGNATTIWTLGTIAGVDTLQATIASGATAKVGAVALAAGMSALVKVSGDSQSVSPGATSQALVVEAVDVYGNAVSNVSVTWAATGGAVLSSTSTMTNASGEASVTATAGVSATTYTITATGSLIASVNFLLTVL